MRLEVAAQAPPLAYALGPTGALERGALQACPWELAALAPSVSLTRG